MKQLGGWSNRDVRVGSNQAINILGQQKSSRCYTEICQGVGSVHVPEGDDRDGWNLWGHCGQVGTMYGDIVDRWGQAAGI